MSGYEYFVTESPFAIACFHGINASDALINIIRY